MNLVLDKQGRLYEQIARALKLAILDGRLAGGSRLPSTRALAIALKVSRTSVLEAYELLSAEHLVMARAGSGTRVAQLGNIPTRPRTSATSPPTSRYAARARKWGAQLRRHSSAGLRYNLAYGMSLVSTAVFKSWRRKLAAAALGAGPAYPLAGGLMPLRRALAIHLARQRGVICDPSDILIVGGTQQAVTIVARVLLDNRDTVVMEDPHYQLVAYGLLAHGAQLVSVRTDVDGLVVQELPRRSIRMAFVTPSHQFPSGVIMPLGRRMELLRWASQTGCWIVEDDYDSEFYSGSRPVPALRSLDLADRVIYVGTFSKTLFPALRLGYIVCPKALRDDLFNAKLFDDLGSPTIEQAALATFIESGQYEKHLRKYGAELTDRRNAVVDALTRFAGSSIEIGPHDGGTHLIVWLRGMTYEQFPLFVQRAASLGLGLHPAHVFYKTRPRSPGLLIGYAGYSSGQLRSAIEVFVACLRETKRLSA